MRTAIRIICLVCLVSFVPTLVSAQPQIPKSPSEIARESSQAVVVIESLDNNDNVIGQGSGFIVTPLGAIVTNFHVVQGATVARVKMPNGDTYRTADVVNVDYEKDIVVLKINGPRFPAVTLGNSDRTDVGEPVVAISSPEGLTNSITTGIISGLRKLETHYVFQITAPISQGSSGGALFDSTGAIIGIVTYLFKSGQNINFAVPISYARGMISNQPMATLAELRPIQAKNESVSLPPKPAEIRESAEQIDGQINAALRGRLGQTEQTPLFVQPLESLTFFNRLVAGIGRLKKQEVENITHAAVLAKSRDTGASEEYTIKYLSPFSGVAMGFNKSDLLLTSVELLINWSVDDLKNTFGGKYRKKTIDGQKILDFGKVQGGTQLIAVLDSDGNVRSVKFSQIK